MHTPSFKEDHISQIPALQLLHNIGYTYLSPEEALEMRGGKTSQVLLEPILRTQLENLNSIPYKGQTYPYSEANINTAIHALKDLPMQEGYITASEYIYRLITLGKALEQTVEGDKKSFTLKYIDWKNPENNAFHVTEEFSVLRTSSKKEYRPDLVLFVNGIPFCIIECKRPDMKNPLDQAISQHLRNQQENGIRPLYVYSQLCLSIATNQAKFGTNGTPPKFWSQWKEKPANPSEEKSDKKKLFSLKNTSLPLTVKEKLFQERFRYVRQHFDALEKETIQPTLQDEYLYNLCRPERLLDLAFNFIVFDENEKKIARYQQYFAVKKTLERITRRDSLQAVPTQRPGGVIWHTQGSGKSLTMVMLAQAIGMEKQIRNPKIILVTDRIDLDDQITGTFDKCGIFVQNATTGQKLVELLEGKSDAVITTVINKFEAAVRKIKTPFTSSDIFVLIDEGHRTQYGTFNIQMQKTMPNACFIAMTGTPLMKREKNTAGKFGGIIDTYTITSAVEDGAVVPILYEGRHAIQEVNEKPIDAYFSMIAEPLTEYQKVDLKKKHSRADQLNMADQKIYAIAWDISRHFRDNWQGTKFKGQMVCQKKEAAIKYKEYLDEIGIVTSEVIMSPPDQREGEDSAYGKSADRIKAFWNKLMDQYGSPRKYETTIINRFKKQAHPEIIIVVDKLLTGFDAPINTVLYITRSLREHTLLQAIARVNRVHPGKDFGYIIDYYGVLKQLDEALETYSDWEEFDEQDLIGTFTNIQAEIATLPQKHSELWDIFKTISNKRDAEAYEELLGDEALRAVFYEKVSAYSRTLKIALSSLDFHKETPEKEINRYKEDAAFFLKLRTSVQQRYSDTIDYKQYEGQIQKLIDKHIHTDEVQPITELVNIFETERFEQELERVGGAGAKADRIASRTAKHISEKMEEDPAFYKKFSEMLKETIQAYREQRISEIEFLQQSQEIMKSVLSRTDSDIPAVLESREVARAFFGLGLESLKEKLTDTNQLQEICIEMALHIDDIIQAQVLDKGIPKIDWSNKSSIIGKLQIEIGDYLIDEVRDKYEVKLSFGEMDELAGRCIDVAKIRYQ